MKKILFILTIIIFLSFIVFSYSSCSSSNAQPVYDTIELKKDMIQHDLVAFNIQDTSQRVILKKEIKKIETDTTWKIKRDSIYQQLEKTSRTIKRQQETIDSLIVIKKKTSGYKR